MEQSLDDILKANQPTRGRGRSSRRSGAGRPAAAAAPVGGVSKSTRQGKQSKAAPTAPAAILSGETKIMVSNLVSRSQYKSLGTFTGNQALVSSVCARTLLTPTSQRTSTKSNSRYVRPMQVFEPIVASLLRASTSPIRKTRPSPSPPVRVLSHVLPKSHLICVGRTRQVVDEQHANISGYRNDESG
jgi:hypothetical protein